MQLEAPLDEVVVCFSKYKVGWRQRVSLESVNLPLELPRTS